MFNGKMKAVTFSYDDGVTQDRRLIEIFNKYGLKCTFNLNSELLGKPGSLVRDGREISHVKVEAGEVRALYAGHEIAGHTLTHPGLKDLDDESIIKQVEQDRLNLSELAGYEVIGMAYPGGTGCMNDHVAELIAGHTGMKYARTTTSTGSFDLQTTDLLRFNPTVYHHVEFDRMFELAEQFLAMEPDKPQLFYIWGHAYEFDIRDDWDRFEDFCRLISGHDDIFYGTNREVLLDR